MSLPSVDIDSFLATPVTWWDALLAVAAIVGGWVASRLAKRSLVALLARVPNLPAGLIAFAARFAQYVVLLLGFGIALALLGANVQPLLAMVLVIGLVVVLVLRGVADNFAAGVLIQTRQSVRLGEEILVEGPDGEAIVGTVAELNSRAVILHTVDGRTVHVPNGQLLGGTLVNHSRRGARRSEVQVRVQAPAAEAPPLSSRIERVVVTTEGVRGDEPVRTLVETISPRRVILRVQFWHDPLRGPAVRSRVVATIASALAEAGWTGTVTSARPAVPLVPSEEI